MMVLQSPLCQIQNYVEEAMVVVSANTAIVNNTGEQLIRVDIPSLFGKSTAPCLMTISAALIVFYSIRGSHGRGECKYCTATVNVT